MNHGFASSIWVAFWAFTGLAGAQTHGGGGPLEQGRCISAEELDSVAVALANYKGHFQPAPSPSGAPAMFTFYPMAGELYGDLYTFNFVDLDPTGAILDWDCTDFTYNGHDATDVMIRSFGEQEIGVPIFAALDGEIVSVHDGEPDKNTSCTGVGNHVIIDHGDGRVCNYWHFKKNSIQVAVGQIVKAGQQLGLTGSSGCSTYPHLHFATYDFGNLVEPYAGPCRTGPSEWVNQTPIRRDLYLADLNVTDVDIGTYPGLPFDMPRTGTFVQGLRRVSFWVILNNLPTNSTWRVRYRRPDGSTALDSGTGAFGNAFARWSWWWWPYDVDLNQTGTWQILFEINGQVLVQAPFDVVASANQIVNRAPNAITANIEPDLATTDDVLICRVGSDLVLDDRDYDIARYRYVWAIGSNVVRDVTTAARSDVLPRHTAAPGSIVTCAVTPSDGIDVGASVEARAAVRGSSSYCSAKINSCGTLPAISSTGEASASSTSGFVISATETKAQRTGILIYSNAGRAAIPFQGGILCVNPASLKRTVPVSDTSGTSGQCDGTLAIDMNAFAHGSLGGHPIPSLLVVGAQIHCQFWAHDSAQSGGLLTDGLEYVVGD